MQRFSQKNNENNKIKINNLKCHECQRPHVVCPYEPSGFRLIRDKVTDENVTSQYFIQIILVKEKE